MITKAQLDWKRDEDILACDLNSLVDAKEITVNRSLPVNQRIRDYVSQIHNPYLYRVGDVAVKVEYVGSKTLTKALADYIATT